MRKSIVFALLLLGLLGLPALAAAQDEISNADNAWIMTSSALVLMMTGPGLALFYGGLVRNKNILATMMQSFAMMALMTVLWAIYGYSLSFAEGNTFIGGFDYLFLNGVGMEPNGSIPHYTFMVFQLMFAIITPALITGAFAERVKFSSLLVFMTAWATIVYFPMVHMVWGGGFMSADGVLACLDFAGGTVVHISSGVSALVMALYIGKRKGYPSEMMRPQNLTLSFVGACLLWVGWFGFNAGSALAADGLAAVAFVNTHFAAAAAVLAWLVLEWIRDGKPSVLGGITGGVAGLVGVTPAAGFVSPMDSLLIGIFASIACYVAVAIIKVRMGYDDSLDAFGVHGMGGTVGAILTGILAREAIGGSPGWIEGSLDQFINNTLGAVLTWILAGAATLVLLKVIDLIMGIRVSESDETEGLDITQHGEEA